MTDQKRGSPNGPTAFESRTKQLHHNVNQLAEKIVNEIKEYLSPFVNEGFIDGQSDAFAIDIPHLLLGKQFTSTCPSWNIYEITGSEDGTFSKYQSLGGIEPVLEEEYEIEFEKFYSKVEGDLNDKGFCDKNGQPLLSWDYDNYLSWAYYDGWIKGLEFVLNEVEPKIKEMAHKSYKNNLI